MLESAQTTQVQPRHQHPVADDGEPEDPKRQRGDKKHQPNQVETEDREKDQQRQQEEQAEEPEGGEEEDDEEAEEEEDERHEPEEDEV